MASSTGSNPMAKLQAQGQSVWIDFMSRAFVEGGDLRQMIEEEGLQGATSNPTIFEAAIGHSADYDADMERLIGDGGDVDAIYQDLAVHDIQGALDLFRPVYDRTKAKDGYVSLEVSPLLAFDGPGTIREAQMYWDLLDRPNAMIKIPGTPECLPAIEECLYRGININVTLLFSVEAYERVARAYIRALKRRADEGKPVDRVASVASFFVSRIDAETDARLEKLKAAETDPGKKVKLDELMGRAAIDNAKNAYALYQELYGTEEWKDLAAEGAMVQRLLWASVGTKNPKYPDTIYIDELIGPETVSTMPPATYKAARDHGRAVEEPTLTQGLAEAAKLESKLAAVGVDFKDVTATLLKKGVESFAKSFEQLTGAIKSKREKLVAAR